MYLNLSLSPHVWTLHILGKNLDAAVLQTGPVTSKNKKFRHFPWKDGPEPVGGDKWFPMVRLISPWVN